MLTGGELRKRSSRNPRPAASTSPTTIPPAAGPDDPGRPLTARHVSGLVAEFVRIRLLRRPPRAEFSRIPHVPHPGAEVAADKLSRFWQTWQAEACGYA